MKPLPATSSAIAASAVQGALLGPVAGNVGVGDVGVGVCPGGRAATTSVVVGVGGTVVGCVVEGVWGSVVVGTGTGIWGTVGWGAVGWGAVGSGGVVRVQSMVTITPHSTPAPDPSADSHRRWFPT